MIAAKVNFKAKLIRQPKDLAGKFKIGKRYRVYGIYDSSNGYTDFLVADNDGVFIWVNTNDFRSK